MPGRYYGQRRMRRGSSLRGVINSNKNIVPNITAGTDGTTASVIVAITVDSALNTVATQVERGCVIKAIWMELWMRPAEEDIVGLTTVVDAYFIKNPGTNLTLPAAGTVGTSNEKKFVLKNWKGLIAAQTFGAQPYTWKGWIKIPKHMQRMGADDLFQFVFEYNGTAGVTCTNFVYKWYK